MLPYWKLGDWVISNYFLLLSLDFCFMIIYLHWRSRKLKLNSHMALDVGIFSTLMGFVGARLFHVIYEAPSYYWENPSAIFKLWNGGYVFLAGALTSFISGSLYIKLKRLALLPWLDLFAPILALGYSIGRWACFLQGCCYGKASSSIWSVHFTNLAETGETTGRLPTQAITSLTEFLLFISLIVYEKINPRFKKPGQIFYIWLTGHGINRILMELLRDDPRGPLLANLGISFWIALILTIIGIILFSLSFRNSNK